VSKKAVTDRSHRPAESKQYSQDNTEYSENRVHSDESGVITFSIFADSLVVSARKQRMALVAGGGVVTALTVRDALEALSWRIFGKKHSRKTFLAHSRPLTGPAISSTLETSLFFGVESRETL
jgi:hypothetical protein